MLRDLRQSAGIMTLCFGDGSTGGLARAFRQSTSGIFGFCTGTTGRLCKALSQATPRIFGFHVGTREGFIICRLNSYNIIKDFPLVRFDGRQHIRFIGVLPDLHLEPPFYKTFREIGVISTHIPLERHFPSQTKIPEKPVAKPLFGDFCCFIFCYSFI